MGVVQDLKKKIRAYFLSHGFSCDACGAEIFDYPKHRLCEACESKMRPNNGRICEKCGRKTLAEGVCLSCKSRLPRFTRGMSPFVYRGESASFINRVKNGNPVLAHYFAENMAEYFLKAYENAGNYVANGEVLLVIPVPITQERRRERGYNQAEELAQTFCERLQEEGLSVELRMDVLEKYRDTAQQKHMDYFSRIENVAGAYHVHERKLCRDRTVILIDDIMTTGATGSECASRLLSAGAREVIFLVAASLPEMK